MDDAINPPVMQDGQYEITEIDEGVYLTVRPPVNGGSPIAETVISQDLNRRKITVFDRSAVAMAVKEASGQLIRIADSLVPDIRVMVRRDRLEVMVDVTTPSGGFVTMIQLLNKLKSAGIVYGINQQALEWLVKARSGKNIVCALGTPPRDGDQAFLKYHVDLESQGRPTEMEDGSVDLKNINSFLNVEAGQLLVEKIPPTPGTPGRDVLGLPIAPKPGKDIPMPTGKNMTVIDNCRLVAAIDGQLHIAHKRLSVLPTIEIKEDVDYSTGNIDFLGNVIVHGSVQTDFSVKAGGNVEIRGTVCGGMVEAKNIIVRMGIAGMNRSVIKARERLVAKFVENATIYADQEVVISDVILNSSIFAGVRVIAEGRRGLIVGGRISAGEEIRARTVGNQSHVNIDLEVASNPFLKDELYNLHIEKKKNGVLAEELKRSLAYMYNQGIHNLSAEKQERYEKMEAECNALPERMEEIQQRIIDIQQILHSIKPGKVRVSDVLYPGVRVSIGSLTKIINDPLKYLSLYAHEGEIKFSPLR